MNIFGMGARVPEKSVTELKRMMDEGTDFVLLDVRDPDEWEVSRIEPAKLIPLGELPGRTGELDPEKTTLVLCHSGARSARAVKMLQEKGFQDVHNVAGGILAWSRSIDPSVPVY